MLDPSDLVDVKDCAVDIVEDALFLLLDVLVLRNKPLSPGKKSISQVDSECTRTMLAFLCDRNAPAAHACNQRTVSLVSGCCPPTALCRMLKTRMKSASASLYRS